MTHRFQIAALCVFGLAACASAAPAPAAKVAPKAEPAAETKVERLTPKQIAERATPSIVRIKGGGTLGTGFIVREDGWIATNLHVIIAGAARPTGRHLAGAVLEVTLKDERTFPVIEVVGIDRDRDVALLRIDAHDIPVLELGEGDDVSVGDPVVVIGHPMGLSDTVSDGLVSAVREVREGLEILQISAPIARGSSGGPLFNTRGQVIGIATAILREGQNLNFAVPVEYLKAVMQSPEPVPYDIFVRTLRPSVAMPTVTRNIPEHQLSLLTGCGEGDLRLLGALIGQAISVGAPAYNAGKFAACYHIYLGASLDSVSRLSPLCSGPKRALAAGRANAKKLTDPAAQAWAMRDAFDGLLEVMARKLAQP